MDIGYIRVSTGVQNTERQLDKVQLDEVFKEKASALTIERPKLEEAKRICRKGDTLHIHSLDRVCRSGAADAVSLVEEMTRKGVSVMFHKDGLRFDGDMTATQKGVLSILASVAQMERELIRERSREGQIRAKANGVKFGRPSKKESLSNDVMKLSESGMSDTAIAKELNIGRTTVWRIKKELRNEQEGAR